MTLYFKNTYILDYYTVLGRNNYEVSVKADEIINNYYLFSKTVEEGEINLLNKSINGLIRKSKVKNIDLCINSDLQNQLLSSNYSMRNIDIPLITHYSACASFIGNLIVASSFINSGLNNVIVSTSSHTLVSEKQFRFPIEYGSIRKKVNTLTATGAVSALVSKNKSNIKIESATIGKVTDIGFSDVNNFGAIMAPSAARTIYEHLKSTNRKIDYYDLVLTGDLGKYGLSILKEYLKEEYDIKANNIIDSGEILFKDTMNQIAGASGPCALPLILFNKIIKENYKKILLVGTGSMHSKSSTNIIKSIPSVSHIISLEVIK